MCLCVCLCIFCQSAQSMCSLLTECLLVRCPFDIFPFIHVLVFGIKCFIHSDNCNKLMMITTSSVFYSTSYVYVCLLYLMLSTRWQSKPLPQSAPCLCTVCLWLSLMHHLLRETFQLGLFRRVQVDAQFLAECNIPMSWTYCTHTLQRYANNTEVKGNLVVNTGHISPTGIRIVTGK